MKQRENNAFSLEDVPLTEGGGGIGESQLNANRQSPSIM
jgi:hypothetical protein